MDPSYNSVHFSYPSFPAAPLLRNYFQVETPAPIHRSSKFVELERHHLEMFWQHQMLELKHFSVHRNLQLPVARIRRMMKLDNDVKFICSDTPRLLTKACELFIWELTLRSWLQTEQQAGRKIMRKCDIAIAVSHANHLQFLMNVVTKDQ